MKQCASVAVDRVEFCELLCFFLGSISITASFLLQFEQFEIQFEKFEGSVSYLSDSVTTAADSICTKLVASAQQLIAVTAT